MNDVEAARANKYIVHRLLVVMNARPCGTPMNLGCLPVRIQL